MSINPLNTAISGLRVAQAQISVSSHNIANATTPGYSRQTLQQYSIIADGKGSGVRAGVVMRQVDDVLVRDYRAQISVQASLQTKGRYFDQLQELYGPPDGELSISSTLGKLQNAFSQLANQPEDTYLLTNAYNKAMQMASQFQNYAKNITQMRNNAQDEMSQAITRINQLTDRIADLNRQIKSATALNQPTGDLEDHRDIAIRELSKDIDLSYFKDSTNAIIVMTKGGQLLADTQPVKLFFNPTPLSALNYYPVSSSPIMLGDPVTGTDITAEKQLGSSLGALVSLRDEILPTYSAQLDELAYRMSQRFSAQGLDMFTTSDGSVPPDDPAQYAGFSRVITVNPQIQVNNSLIRTGTDPNSQIQAGSSQLLSKIVEFAFGSNQYEQLLGNVDLSDPVQPLFTTLGLQAQARVMGTMRLDNIGALDTLPGISDTGPSDFNIQFGANPPLNIVINPGDGLTELVTAINTAITGAGLTNTQASIGPGGQLVLTSTQSIGIQTGTINAFGLASLGLTPSVTPAQNPSFEIALGDSYMTKIEILPTDTGADLVTKLNAIPGMDASLTVPGGFLQIRPLNGGDLTFIDSFGNPLAAMNIQQSSIPNPPFKVLNLGPGANLNGRIQTSTSLHDYATQIVGLQSQDAADNDMALSGTTSYKNTIEKSFLDRTGVNIDEEMASLVTIQMAYTASARTVSAIQSMMDELFNAF